MIPSRKRPGMVDFDNHVSEQSLKRHHRNAFDLRVKSIIMMFRGNITFGSIIYLYT